MMDILFSNIAITALIVGGVGCFCFYNSGKIKQRLYNNAWTMTKVYVSVTDMFSYKTIDGYLADSDTDDTDDENKYNYFPYVGDDSDNKDKLYYIDGDNTNVIYLDNVERVTEICKTTPEIMFIAKEIDNMLYFKRTDNPLIDTDFEVYTDKTFLQIEVIDVKNQYTLSIHKFMKGFMVKGNKVLDKSFLKWVMRFFLSNKLSDEYAVKIFDKNINYVKLTPDDYILLTDNVEHTYEQKSILDVVESSGAEAIAGAEESVVASAGAESAVESAGAESVVESASAASAVESVVESMVESMVESIVESAVENVVEVIAAASEESIVAEEESIMENDSDDSDLHPVGVFSDEGSDCSTSSQ
jgi:hypothetical protein